MNKFLQLLFNFSVLICANACQANVKYSDSSLPKIDAILQQLYPADKPGLTIGIISNGKLVFQKGYGMADIKKRVPNSPQVLYKVASVTKQFTAATILELVRKNKLALTDEVRKHIPAFPDYGVSITVSDLLYHTSGIRDYMVLMWLTGVSFESEFSNEDALQMIFRQKNLNFTPRTRCVYSNSNYILLAEIVKRVTGQSLSAYAAENIFKPMKMYETGFGNSAVNKKSFAISYAKTEKAFVAYKNLHTASGDGGLFTTLDDLVKWDASFYDNTSLNHQLLTLGKLGNGNPLYYGMGIMTGRYRNEPIQMHPGAFLGYRAELLRFPRKNISIICLGNLEDINPESITRQIADLYVFNDEVAGGKESLKDYNMKVVAEVQGRYEVNSNVFIDIKFEAGLLTGQASGQPKQALYPRSPKKFTIGNTTDEVSFNEDSLGKLYQLTIRQKQGNTIAKKLETVSENLEAYTGQYFNDEQNAIYNFFIEKGKLFFKVGANPKTPITVLKKYNKAFFSYKNLENASIDFNRNGSGEVTGFTLNSGRISGLKFARKQH